MRNPFGSSTTLLSKKPKPKVTNNTILTKEPVVSENSAAHGQPGHVHQSGDDWGMEDLDDYFGTDLANMNPHETTTTATTLGTQTGGTGDTPNPFGSNTTLLDKNPTIITTETGNINPALEEGIKGDTNTTLPGEINGGFSSDFTDSGQQTETDQPLSMEEIIYDQTGPDAGPDKDVPGVKGWREKLAGLSDSGTLGGGYGKKRVGEMSRKQMHLTGARNRSILTSKKR